MDSYIFQKIVKPTLTHFKHNFNEKNASPYTAIFILYIMHCLHLSATNDLITDLSSNL